MTRPGLALILSGFPRRSETFALHEATALLRTGLLTAVFATKPGDGLPPQPGSEALLEHVHLLPSGTADQQGAAVSRHLDGRPVAGVHAYFAHTPTAVAMQVAGQLGVPYGFSMHAKDARKVTPTELNRRARRATCVVACNPDVAGAVTDPTASVTILPHGVDLQRFQPTPLPVEPTIRLLAVGRLVEKKGFDLLVRAAAGFTFPFTLTIVGDGPEGAALTQLIATLGLQAQISLRGGVTHTELPALYAAAHLVVVPSVVDRDGDRDGLPNVLLEAMAAGRPVVASDVAAIRSAVIDGESGLLIPPGDVAVLAATLNRLAAAPELRHALACNGYRRVVQHFALSTCTDRFCDFIAKSYTL